MPTMTLAAESPLVFEQPIWLFLLLLIVPAFFLSLRSIGGLSRAKAITTFTIRTIVILLLTMALAHPSWEKRGEGVTTTLVLDRSLSVPHRLKKDSVDFLRIASENDTRRRDDRIAVVTVARDASISAMADTHSTVEVGMEPADLKATNLADGVRMAMAIGPADTANRIIIASDGNETMDNVLEAASIAAANGIPVDVLVLEYEHENEVIFERLVAPARVRRGQSANVKMVLRSQTDASGTISLTMNGQTVDLNGDDPGSGRQVVLEPGPFVLQVPISMDQPGPQQFRATIALDGQGDLTDNNKAVAVTFVGSEGRVLCVDRDPAETEHLVRALNDAEIAVDRTAPDQLGAGLVYLSGYDAIVLANVPRYDFDESQ
ncbi:MAG: vWA domain-containing protein, partial [Planctomycetota bacterium]